MKFLLFLFTFNIVLFGQQNNNEPKVELPDFVIMGDDVVNIEKTDKYAPEINSVLSNDYIKPEYSSEKLEPLDLSNPLPDEFILHDSLHFYNHSFSIAAGFNNLPLASYRFNTFTENNIFNLGISANNIRPYIKNTDKMFLNGFADYLIHISDGESIFSNSDIRFNGLLNNSSYRIYNAPIVQKLNKLDGGGSFQIKNLNNALIQYDLELKDEFATLKEENYYDNNLSLNFYGNLKLDNFSIGILSKFKFDNFEGDSLKDLSTSFISLRPFVGFKINEFFRALAGLQYNAQGGNDFIGPFVSVGLQFDKKFNIYGEFAPQAIYYGSLNFLNKNPYFNTRSLRNNFETRTNSISAFVKYENPMNFEANGGFKFFSASNHPYFTTSNRLGTFDIKTADVNRIELEFNVIYYTFYYGTFYSSLNFSSTKNKDSDKSLPYNPGIEASASYSYTFSGKLITEVKGIFNSSTYADSLNLKKIEPFINLQLKAEYKLTDNFFIALSALNLLNRNNAVWLNYKEMPLDILAGIKYNW